MSERSSPGGGCFGGFGGMLAVLFIGLKLTGYISWSWLWVLSPLWIPVGISLLFFALAILAEIFK